MASKFQLALFLAIVALSGPSLHAHGAGDRVDFATEAAAAPQALAREPALDRLAEAIDQLIAAGEPVGSEVLIAQHGEILFHESFGWSDRDAGRKMEKNSIFSVASMTKPIVGTAILMLADEGRLSLDDHVSRYLPSFDNSRSAGITIQHLLTHQAGFDYWGPFPSRNDVAAQPDLRTAVDKAGEAGPSWAVGERHVYSNMSSLTLAAVIEAVSGQPAEEFLNKRIFEPLGMNDTHPTFSPDASWANRVNPIYCYEPSASRFEVCWSPSQEARVPYFRGSGGVRATVADYLRFMTLWMNKGVFEGRRLLSQAAIEDALLTRAGRVYGYHWQVPEAARSDGLPAAFGHSGADGTVAVAYPAAGAVVLVFTQSGESALKAPAAAIIDLVRESGVIDHLGPFQPDMIRPAGIDDLQPPAAELKAFAGTFRTEDKGGADLSIELSPDRLRAKFVGEEGGWTDVLVQVADGVFAPGVFDGTQVAELSPTLTYRFSRTGEHISGVTLNFEDEVVFHFVSTKEPDASN